MGTHRELPTMRMEFADKNVSFAIFVQAVAAEVVHMIRQEEKDPPLISQRQAYRIFGRRNVDRWRTNGRITPFKRPGKIEYITSELRYLQRTEQDYLF